MARRIWIAAEEMPFAESTLAAAKAAGASEILSVQDPAAERLGAVNADSLMWVAETPEEHNAFREWVASWAAPPRATLAPPRPTYH